MTSAGTNSGSGITGNNSNNNFPSQPIPILRNLGSSYRVRPATIFPSDPMNESISILSSENQSSSVAETSSTIDLTSAANNSYLHNSSTNNLNQRKDPIRKLIGKGRSRGNRGKNLQSNQTVPNHTRSCPKRTV